MSVKKYIKTPNLREYQKSKDRESPYYSRYMNCRSRQYKLLLERDKYKRQVAILTKTLHNILPNYIKTLNYLKELSNASKNKPDNREP